MYSKNLIEEYIKDIIDKIEYKENIFLEETEEIEKIKLTVEIKVLKNIYFDLTVRLWRIEEYQEEQEKEDIGRKMYERRVLKDQNEALSRRMEYERKQCSNNSLKTREKDVHDRWWDVITSNADFGMIIK